MRSATLRGTRNLHLLSMLAAVAVCTAVANGATAPEVGERIDLAQFGAPLVSEKSIGVEWENPREVHEVRLTGAGLDPKKLRLEWWGAIWPNNGTGGWMRLDDHWNGEWVVGKVTARAEGDAVVFRFEPLTKQEWRESLDKYPDDKAPTFRKTLKVRVVCDEGPLPKDARLATLGSATWAYGSFDIFVRNVKDARRAGRVEAINGLIGGVEVLPDTTDVELADGVWKAGGDSEKPIGVRVRVHYAKTADPNANELTRVTVRVGEGPRATGFSFVPQDVPERGAMEVRDVDVLVARSENGVRPETYTGPVDAEWPATVRKRLLDQPEMTREMAMEGIPRLKTRDVPLGVPSARQEIVIHPGSDWAFDPGSLYTEARDTRKVPFRDKGTLFAELDTRVEPKFDGGGREDWQRNLEEEHLPLIHIRWRTGGIQYHHALATTILLGDISEDNKRRGDESIVLLTRLEITNQSAAPEKASVSLRFTDPTLLELTPEGLIELRPLDPTKIPDGMIAQRGLISMNTPVGGGVDGWTVRPSADSRRSSTLTWQKELAPGQKQVIYFKATYVDLLDAQEAEAFRTISYEERIPRDLAYWKERLARGMQIDVPDPMLMSFYKANLWHNVITTDRDPETGLYNQGVGTFRYKVFANETVMIARSMDMRGEHTEAERYLEPMLHYQGAESLSGRFSTRDGAFHSAGGYTHGQYAMNHGFVLWGVVDHYFFTRNRAYMERVAPKLIKGCDFLIRERQSTMNAPQFGPNGLQGGLGARGLIHGLAPASSLEDVIEYKYWIATNSYFCLGMKKVAEALASINHPEAERIAREAEAYRRDIEAAAREATTQAAAARLRDGRYVPYVPSRIDHWRHLTEGWIREALYCGVDLAVAGVISHDDPMTTWILDELEDNIYFSWQSGYNVKDYEKTWFSRGGVTLQPCLVDTPRIYMLRDEPKAALRNFWNSYALLIYPDVHCFAEWARSFGNGGGPLYKTADEARFVMWLRQFLVYEDGDTLWLGRNVPRAWLADGKTVRISGAATFFGRAGLTLRSEAGSGRIHAEIDVPRRNPPKELRLRLRHPEGKPIASATLNGEALTADRIAGEDILLPVKGLDLSGPVKIVANY